MRTLLTHWLQALIFLVSFGAMIDGAIAWRSGSITSSTTIIVFGTMAGAPGTTYVTVQWTNYPASNAQVCYGTTTAYGTCTTRDASPTLSDSATITGLSVNQTYHFKVNATKSGYSQGFSSDQTFTTPYSSGTTYYVDYTNSSGLANDTTNAGTSTSVPWLHAPGDPNAGTKPAAKAAANAMNPGDTVCFKGGETYAGSIQLHSAGATGQYIIYEGNNCWGGQATLSGYTTATISCTTDPTFSSLSDCILPSNMVPTGTAGGTPLSAWYNIININGTVSGLANNSTGSNQWFPATIGGPTLAASQFVCTASCVISGSQQNGTGWTFTPNAVTDATLITNLNALTSTQITSLILNIHQYPPNDDSLLTVTGWDGTNLTVTGAYIQDYPATHSVYYTVQNIPSYISGGNPYPQYAIEQCATSSTPPCSGTQSYYLIANVSTGNNTVAVSKALFAFRNGLSSDYAFDGFIITGYACCTYAPIWWESENGIQVSNNTLLHDGSAISGASINLIGVTGCLISNNTLGPDFPSAKGINLGNQSGNNTTNCTVTANTIDQPGWDPIFTQGVTNVTISFNRFTNWYNAHGICIVSYGAIGSQNQNVTINNNQCTNDPTITTVEPSGIAMQGIPTGSGPDALPDNMVVSWNIVQSVAGGSFQTFGNLNGVTHAGNIAYNNNSPVAPTGPIAPNYGSKNASMIWGPDIYDAFPGDGGTLPSFLEITGATATSTQNLTAYPTINWNGHLGGTGNAVNTGLNAILASDLANPGLLSPTTCNALHANSGQQVGIDYLCP